MSQFQTHDSGERQVYDSGMQRDVSNSKIDYTLCLDGPMFQRWAELMDRGARKYDKRNWMRATGEEELERFKESAFRHFIQWMNGDTDEDHAAAVIFNINGAEYVREKEPPIREGSGNPAPQRIYFSDTPDVKEWPVADDIKPGTMIEYDAKEKPGKMWVPKGVTYIDLGEVTMEELEEDIDIAINGPNVDDNTIPGFFDPPSDEELYETYGKGKIYDLKELHDRCQPKESKGKDWSPKEFLAEMEKALDSCRPDWVSGCYCKPGKLTEDEAVEAWDDDN